MERTDSAGRQGDWGGRGTMVKRVGLPVTYCGKDESMQWLGYWWEGYLGQVRMFPVSVRANVPALLCEM